MTPRANATRLFKSLPFSSSAALRNPRLLPRLTERNLVSRSPSRPPSFSTSLRKMASDDDYMAFLNKANQDTGAAAVQQSGTVKTKTVDSEVPKAIRDVCQDAVYVSEADEPFEEVSLKWGGSGGLPDEETFAKLINLPNPKQGDIDILDPLDWDSRGQYTNVIDAVRQASRGNDVRVYKVVRDRTRVEYWLVTSEEGRVVGVKALAIES